MVAKSPKATRYIEVLQAMSLPPSPAPIATGWSDSCRAGFAPAVGQRRQGAQEAGRAWNLVDIRVPDTDKELAASGFSFHLRRDRLRRVRRREGRYLLRSNMVAEDPATLWQLYMKLVDIEQAFKELKHDLAVRPIFHQREERIEAHIFVSFIAYCLLVTLKNLARPRANGLTPRAIIEAFATIQMVDVHLPTTDGRHLVLPRHTRPNKEHELLLNQLGMTLPQQTAPRIRA